MRFDRRMNHVARFLIIFLYPVLDCAGIGDEMVDAVSREPVPEAQLREEERNKMFDDLGIFEFADIVMSVAPEKSRGCVAVADMESVRLSDHSLGKHGGRGKHNVVIRKVISLDGMWHERKKPLVFFDAERNIL